MQGRRQHGDVASDLAQAEVLHQHRPQLFQRALLVFAVHGRAGIDHVAQAGVIPGVDGRMFDQHLDDGGHGEHVAHPMALHQLPDLLGVEARGRRQHGAGGARHLGQQMDAGAVRQRRHGQADVLLGRARHEIAQMIGDHEGHLPMRQHRRFRPPGGAGREEEPAGIVMLHIDAGRRGAPLRLDQVRDLGRGEAFRPQPCQQRQLRHGPRHGLGVVGIVALAQEHLGARCLRQIGRLVRCDAEVRRHPDGAQAQRGEERFDEFKAVARMHQHAVALAHAMGGQRPPAALRPSSSRQLSVASPQISACRSGCRRAACTRKWARFITRRDTGATPPSGICAAGPLIWRAPGC